MLYLLLEEYQYKINILVLKKYGSYYWNLHLWMSTINALESRKKIDKNS